MKRSLAHSQNLMGGEAYIPRAGLGISLGPTCLSQTKNSEEVLHTQGLSVPRPGH